MNINFSKINNVLLEKVNLLKTKTGKIIALSLIALALIFLTYFFFSRPTFSATHIITGEDEERVFVLETTTPKGSLVTMNLNSFYSKTASKDSLVTMNKTQEQRSDANGKTFFIILPGELKNGLNKIKFEVKSPWGMRKKFYYTIDKTQMPITLKVNISDEAIDNENIKKVTVVTDPLNTIYVNRNMNIINSKTGQEHFDIKNYDLIQLSGTDPANLPEILETIINISVTDVDGRERSEAFPVKVSTFTNLTVNQPEETDLENIAISGSASPGAFITIAGENTVSDNAGNYALTMSLPKIGNNRFQITATRPGENKSTRIIIVKRLEPKVELFIDSHTVIDRNLTINGNATPGAEVTVNGQAVIVEENNKFSWSYTFSPGVSKEYIFYVKAQKSGYRSSEEKVAIPRMPVFRNPFSDESEA